MKIVRNPDSEKWYEVGRRGPIEDKDGTVMIPVRFEMSGFVKFDSMREYQDYFGEQSK